MKIQKYAVNQYLIESVLSKVREEHRRPDGKSCLVVWHIV